MVEKDDILKNKKKLVMMKTSSMDEDISFLIHRNKLDDEPVEINTDDSSSHYPRNKLYGRD